MSYQDHVERERAKFGRVVEWVRESLPYAVAWAEADLLATRRARKINADRAVRTGHCAIGHNWRDGGVHVWPPEDHMAGSLCGYCVNAEQHERMWAPPRPALRMDPLKYTSREARANWQGPT